MPHGKLINNIYVKRENEKHLLRMGGGAWTINLNEVELAEVRGVVYITPKARYAIEAGTALKYGYIKTLGGEPKLVVPLSKWRYIANDTTGKA